MKNIIKISSLGLVALLASCSKNIATPLKKIDPEAAKSVAQALSSNQKIEKQITFNKKTEMEENVMLTGNYFPYTATSMSADITIRNVSKMQMSGMFPINEDEERIIKKHVYFDMKNLFYHAHISMTLTSNSPIKETYPNLDYYFFFVEDKKQDEETVKTEYDKLGTFYNLVNVGGLMKMMILNFSGITKAEATQAICAPFIEYNPIFTNQFNIDEALSYSLLSPTINWSVMEDIYKNVGGTGFAGKSNKILIMNEWFDDYFAGVADNFEDLRGKMKDLNDENSYFNYVFRSNDATSLGIEADARLVVNESYGEEYTVTGYMQEATSLTFRDLYLSECHFIIGNEANIHVSQYGMETDSYTSSTTTCDQYIEYNTKESDTYPNDYLEYNPGI